MAELVMTSGEVAEVHPHKGKSFTQEELRALLGGKPEVEEIAPDRFLIRNHDGRELGLPFNVGVADPWWGAEPYPHTEILGDVLLATSQEVGA
jgi:hypothetical protein